MRRDTEQLANVFVDCRHAYLVDVLVKRFDSRNGTCRQAFKIAAAHVAKPASEIHHGNASIDDAVGKMPDANGVGRACTSASIAADAKREQALLVLRSWRTKKVPLSGKGFYRSPERNQRARRDAAFCGALPCAAAMPFYPSTATLKRANLQSISSPLTDAPNV